MTIDTRLAEVDLAQPTYLLVSGKDGLPDVVPLEIGASVFVGTGSTCKVQLQDESVQQLHCMFLLGEDNVLKVQDWNTGATYLNGQLVTDESVMRSGDMIDIGCYCLTAVLDVEFHKGIAVELLNGDGSGNAPEEIESLELPAPVDVGCYEESSAEESDHDGVVAGFNVGDESTVKADGETKQTSEGGFKYDIDSNLTEDATAGSDAFDSLPTDLGFAFGSGEAKGGEETSLLLMEVEQLRFELADRDSQVLALKNERDSEDNVPVIDDGDTLKLVTRLEDLLVELQASDDRIQSLEDLLRLSEDAVAAERNERAQMEKWVSEIENRIGQRELESQAEIAGLIKQLRVAKDDAGVLQSQLHSVSIAGIDSDKQAEAVAALNRKVEELRVSLQQANEKNQELLQRPVQSEDEAELIAKLRGAQDELATLRLEASKQRAENARRDVEFESMRAGLERQISQASRTSDDGSPADARIQAMREHLREIHEQEQATKAEQHSNSLGGRITNLLSRLR